MTSEYQDCDMQLWKKQNFFEFKNLSKRSRVILIEKHFKPTYSRITSTIQNSVTIRRRWSANRTIQSYSSCAKQYQKYNVLTVFFLESRNCVLLLRIIHGQQRIQKKVWQIKTGCILYPALRDQERALPWCSTWQNRRTERVTYGLDYVEEMLQESLLSRWTFQRCSRSITQGSSLSWITSRNRMYRAKKCKEMDELAKENDTYHLTPEEQRRYQGQWYLTLNKSDKNGPKKLRSDCRVAVSIKDRLHCESDEKVEEPIHPEQYRRRHPFSSTSWWDKSEWNWKFAQNVF